MLYNPPHAKTQVPVDLYPVIRSEVPAVIGIKVLVPARLPELFPEE